LTRLFFEELGQEDSAVHQLAGTRDVHAVRLAATLASEISAGTDTIGSAPTVDTPCRNSYPGGMKSVVSEKGQVTIPKPIRDSLGLRPGTAMQFEAKGGKLVGVKAVSEDVFRKWRGRGKLPGGASVDEFLRRARGAS